MADETPKAATSGRPFPACRTSPILRPRPSASSTCSSPAGRRRWTCSTTSRALKELHGKELPDSIRMGQRLTGMTLRRIAASRWRLRIFKFAQHGKSGAWVSELLPHTAKIADDLCFIKSMHTEAINHDPAITFIQTGAQIAGRPSIGSWLAYGLGSENKDLPAFVVLISQGAGGASQPLYDRLWGSGFLPTQYQGVKFRSVGDPVLYLSNPPGFARGRPPRVCSTLGQAEPDEPGRNSATPRSATRIAQYEMAFRMQTSVPELTDLSKEPDERFRALRRRRPQAGHLRRQLPAGPPAGRARRALHPALPPRLGPARQPAQGPAATVPATPTRRPRRWYRT